MGAFSSFKSSPYFKKDSREIVGRFFFLGVCKNNSVLATPMFAYEIRNVEANVSFTISSAAC